MTHLLVTNDFPPKVGGIQSYLWELWRRLPPGEATILTTPHPAASAWDAEQPFRVHRTRRPYLVPTPDLARQVNRLAAEVEASVVLLDPAWPLGLLARWLDRPYGVVLHGAEVTIPGHLPLERQLLGAILRHSRLVVAAGDYPAAEGERAAGAPLPLVRIPPGVDTGRFHPPTPAHRDEVRGRYGLEPGDEVVVGISRLVRRKGLDVLLAASAELAPNRPRLRVLIGGDGRDRRRLLALADRTGAPARLLGRVEDADLPDLYGAADVFAMLCRNRWGGLEQEGFGIVFLEAAACGVPQIAGRSGGSHEAVEHGRTGLVVDRPGDVVAVSAALADLLNDDSRRSAMGAAARHRAERCFTYDELAARLADGLAGR